MNKKETQFKSQFEFILTTPIEYQGERDNPTTNILLLKAPANIHRDILDKIKPIVIDSFLSMSKKVSGSSQINPKESDKSKSNAAIGKGEILMSLAANNKLVEVKKLFIELLTRGCCLVDKKLEATDWHISQINDVPPVDDLEDLMGEYLENFLVSSWLKRLLQK
jgi:hypothetical protein